MKKKISLYQLTTCALMAAVMCVLGPLSIPIGPVPVSLTNFVVYLAICLLGMKGAFLSCLIFLLLGAVGMPVFSGYQGGLAKLAGPTGGYLIGYLFVSLLAGWFVDRFHGKLVPSVIGLVLGTALLYVFGTGWFVIMMKCEIWYALSVCVFPFIAFDLGKVIVAAGFGKVIRTALARANLLPS